MRDDLPTGTVTFLFTDIEGSTRLLAELGSRYADALAEHHRLIRAAVGRHGGVEFGTQGDALFVAFSDANDALDAAEDAQRALEAHETLVRMGVHTGQPLLTDEGYVGLDVHRVARICAAGHGGQVLVSEATRRAVARELHALGAHRLKDLGRPEALYQLGEREFPPLASLNQSTLPTQTTPFLGRDRELGEVLALFRREDVRVITLTGPGGTGKTRLAVQAAAEQVEHLPHGVWWVPLQALVDAAMVVPTIASALGVADVRDDLAGKRMLLLLDNVEHVLDAAPDLAELLDAAPGVTLLATSREPLGLAAEHVYAVPPFDEWLAVELFSERARAVVPAFEPDEFVSQICARLDGIPLAIELAAARVSSLPPATMLQRLDRRLPLLTSGRRDAPERQRTLRSTIAWSYDLLDADERELFGRLGVFAGGCTLEAAEKVADAGLEQLHSLVSKSLLGHEGGRYSMLETIREYALERLDETGDGEHRRRRHAQHYLDVVTVENERWAGGEEVESLAALGAEVANIQASLAWGLDEEGVDRARLGLRLASSMGRFWYMRAHVLDGRMWLERAIAADPGDDTEDRIVALRWLGVLADEHGDLTVAMSALQESTDLTRQSGDRVQLARSLQSLGIVTRNAGDGERSRALLTESLAIRRELGDRSSLSAPLTNLALVSHDAGDIEGARSLLEESLALDRELGSTSGVAVNLVNLGSIAIELDDLERARALLQEALAAFVELGDPDGIAASLETITALCVREERNSEAVRLAGAALALREAHSTPLAARDRAGLDRDLARAVAALGENAFTDAFEAGRMLDQAAAVAAARRELEGRRSHA